MIQQFEPVFIEAGKLASKLREKAAVHYKATSGIEEIDIVTSADLAVQELILEKLAQSDLKNCELLAEEDTPSVKLFAKSADLVLTLDPIDGTKSYADGKRMYLLIITLHDKEKPIYTFDYFPELDWGIKIVGKENKFFGQTPQFKVYPHSNKMIIKYFHKSPVTLESRDPKLAKKLSADGYKLVGRQEISDEAGATMLFVLGFADGYFMTNGSATDALVALHYGTANGYKIFRDLDLSKTIAPSIPGGNDEYEGWYLVIRSSTN